MTTTLERLDKATYQHSHLEDLRDAHTEAREQWQAVAADTAKQMHAFADWLHTATLEDLIDEFAGDQTRDWHMFAEPRAIQPTAVIPAEAQVPGPVIRRELPGLTSDGHRNAAALEVSVPVVLSGPSPDDTLPGREARGDGIPVLAAAYRGERPALEAGPGWTPCGVTVDFKLGEVFRCIEPSGHEMPHRASDGAELWPLSRWQRWRARWRSEWAEFWGDVKELPRDMWHEFKRKWNVDE